MNQIASIAAKLFGANHPCRCGGGHVSCLGCAVCRADHSDQLYDLAWGLAAIIDATLLRADAAQSEVVALCDLANERKCASGCVNAHCAHLIRLRLATAVKSCMVINFPLGAAYRYAVAAQALAVVNTGVEELDMVQNLSAVKSGHPLHSYEMVKGVAELCRENGILLKVILETCFLSPEELIACALYAKKAGADFVKTSTGFGSAGATEENVRLLREVVGPKLGVKASGGIKTREQALAMVAAGANRIGASNVLALL